MHANVYGQRRLVALSPELASEIYEQHMMKLFFPHLVTYMSNKPILVMQLARERAVSYWKELTGPTNPVKARITHPDRWAVPISRSLYIHILWLISVKYRSLNCSCLHYFNFQLAKTCLCALYVFCSVSVTVNNDIFGIVDCRLKL